MSMEQAFAHIDEKWRSTFIDLVKVVSDNIPDGFELIEQYEGISYVVPLRLYPKGYHVTPDTPLPFITIIAQKRHLALYHMGIYADKELLSWFQHEYKNHVSTKLNMGKSCIRFANAKHIPYELLGELVSRMTPAQWIERYEAEITR